jgi:hypothetical protein
VQPSLSTTSQKAVDNGEKPHYSPDGDDGEGAAVRLEKII